MTVPATTPDADHRPLRFGVLSTARITASALVEPASRSSVDVVAVASRDTDKATAFAQAHGIANVSRSYSELLDRDDLDAVYIPLPASLRCEWTLRALERGLHVLAEKPIGVDAGQARDMVAAAEEHSLVLAEGFHYSFHPMFTRALELARDGGLGAIEHIDAVFDLPVTRGPESALYLDATLGGGVLLHQACYALHAVRSLLGHEPEVQSATAEFGDTGVDEAIDISLTSPTGATARVRASMQPDAQWMMRATVHATHATMTLDNFIGPHAGNLDPTLSGRITVTTGDTVTVDEHFTDDTTYAHQLRAFVDALRNGTILPAVQGQSIVANMALIDAVRTAANMGQPRRQPGLT